MTDTDKSAHTPPPWTASGIRQRLARQPFLTVDGPKGVVAYIPYSDQQFSDHVEAHADQHLIAAAPDMLAALERLALAFGKPESDAEKQARAAIAKAQP